MKQTVYYSTFGEKQIREQDPLKQGLKQVSAVVFFTVETIREQDPLKQGLKLKNPKMLVVIISKIREQDPLKQGLKHGRWSIECGALSLFVSKIH